MYAFALSQSYVCHDSFICVPWHIHMCAMTHSYVCYHSLMDMCAISQSHIENLNMGSLQWFPHWTFRWIVVGSHNQLFTSNFMINRCGIPPRTDESHIEISGEWDPSLNSPICGVRWGTPHWTFSWVVVGSHIVLFDGSWARMRMYEGDLTHLTECRHDAFICVTWLIHTWHDSWMWCVLLICLTSLIHVWMRHVFLWYVGLFRQEIGLFWQNTDRL